MNIETAIAVGMPVVMGHDANQELIAELNAQGLEVYSYIDITELEEPNLKDMIEGIWRFDEEDNPEEYAEEVLKVKERYAAEVEEIKKKKDAGGYITMCRVESEEVEFVLAEFDKGALPVKFDADGKPNGKKVDTSAPGVKNEDMALAVQEDIRMREARLERKNTIAFGKKYKELHEAFTKHQPDYSKDVSGLEKHELIACVLGMVNYSNHKLISAEAKKSGNESWFYDNESKLKVAKHFMTLEYSVIAVMLAKLIRSNIHKSWCNPIGEQSEINSGLMAMHYRTMLERMPEQTKQIDDAYAKASEKRINNANKVIAKLKEQLAELQPANDKKKAGRKKKDATNVD